MRAVVVAACMAMAIAMAGAPLISAHAADIDHLPGAPFFLITQGTPMRELLGEFASNYGLSAIVSPAVTDVFVGNLQRSTPREALQTLSRDYGLAWYLTGNALYVYKAQEAKDVVITPTWLSVNDLITRLQVAGVLSSPFCQASAMSDLNSIDVFGVPQCIDRVRRLVRSVDVNAQHTDQDNEAIEVFPLKYASASDSVFMFRDQKVNVPGVVTELREMSQNQSLPVVSPLSVQPVIPLPSTTGSTSALQTSTGVSGMPPLPPATGAVTSSWSDQLPLFAADIRQNAVIVRDHRANMGIYRALIPQLDKRPVQIEISVDIIDVDAGNLKSLGGDFSGTANVGGHGLSINGGSDTFSTVVNSKSRFFERITALEVSAKARIISSPSVVTLNNIEAVLDRNITFYAKLQGRDVAQLQSVASGSLLRVTPRLVTDHGEHQIMLTLDIQDGQQQTSDDRVDSLPQVQNSSITTEAILKPGQSLLLGGFIQKSDVSGTRRVPWLSSIPVVGALFRSTSDSGQSVVRLFLIRARPLSGMTSGQTEETGDDADGAIAVPEGGSSPLPQLSTLPESSGAAADAEGASWRQDGVPSGSVGASAASAAGKEDDSGALPGPVNIHR